MISLPKNKYIIFVFIAILFAGCETPKGPDFKTSHKIETPLLLNKEYEFIGGDNAIFDTTSADFENLFRLDSDNHVILSFEEQFQLDGIRNAEPKIDFEGTNLNSKFGPINIKNFLAAGSLNENINFQDIISQNSNAFPPGTPIPAGSTPNEASVDLYGKLDYYKSASIIGGYINITLTNKLGIDLSSIEIILYSNQVVVGSTKITDVFYNNDTITAKIEIPQNSTLYDLNAAVKTEWEAQEIQSNPEYISIDNIEGEDLYASYAEIATPEHEFASVSKMAIDTSSFSFDQNPTNYIELKNGTLNIGQIYNGLDLDIDLLTISSADIRKPPYGISDTLKIEYAGQNKLKRNSYTDYRSVDLENYRLYATDDSITYTISATTENTLNNASGDKIRVLNQESGLNSYINADNISINKAKGVAKKQLVWLNNDEYGDDVVDIFNNNEVELVELEDMKSFSEQLNGLEFVEPTLDLNYNSNLGATSDIYLAVMGVNEQNESIYLTGVNKNGEFEVDENAPTEGLTEHGSPIAKSNLLKISIDKSPNNDLETGQINFNKNNSNIDEFFNKLPSKIRIIGKAVVNPSNENITFKTPYIFNPSFGIDIPLNIISDNATFVDTLDTDLTELPGEDDDSSITEGFIEFKYSNNLPIGMNFKLNFLDELKNTLITTPLTTDLPLILGPAEIDDITSFSTKPNDGNMILTLNEEQLKLINRTTHIELSSTLLTSETAGQGNSVKLRATDTFKISARAKITVQTHIK